MAITATPEEMLAAALDEVDRRSARLERRRRADEGGQQRATAVSGLAAAAQRFFENADAKYRVLSHTGDIEEPVHGVPAAPHKVTDAAGRLASGAGTAVAALEVLEADLDAAASAAPEGHKARLRSAARSVHRGRTALAREHDTLLRELETIRRDCEAASAWAGGGRLGAADATDLDQVRAERDRAQLALSQAPEVERAAQANLRARQAELAEAQADYAVAEAALDSAESHFIDRIELTGPDAQGLVDAQVLLKQPLPAGYQVRWAIDAGMVVEAADTRVLIDVRALPPGNHAITAHLYRVQATSS
jgi:hypothetical protein